MNKIQLAKHFGITRQRLYQLIRAGKIRQEPSGEWVRIPQKHGSKPKLRESYAAIGKQLGYAPQTIARLDILGHLEDTGNGWRATDQMYRSGTVGKPTRLRQSYAAIGKQLGIHRTRVSVLAAAGRLVDTGDGWQIIDKLSSNPIDSQ